MPFFDRFWWLRAIGALLSAAGAAGALWLAVPALRDDPAGVLTWNTFIFAFIVLFLAGTALVLGIEAGHARDRAARRRAAIDGNQDAVPRSRINVPSASAPDLATAPLVVEWPFGRLERPLIARLRIWAGMVGVILWSAGLSLFFTPLPFTVVYIVVLALAVVCSLPIRALRRTLVQTYGSPRRMTVNAEGILWEPILGLQQLIRWHDARLLEVSLYKARAGWTGEEMAGRRYTLYTPDLAIWWNDFGRRYRAPSGDLAALLAAVSARTGLVPRTFNLDLTIIEGAPNPGLTDRYEFHRAHPELDLDAVYELIQMRPAPTVRARIIAGAIGAILSAGAIVAVLWALDRLYLFAEPDAVIRYTVAGIYIVFGGLIGPVLLVAALRHPPRSPGMFGVRADATGLSERYTQGRVPRLWSQAAGANNGAEPPRIPWSEVAGISMVPLRRGRRLYAVTSEGDTGTIMWSERGSQSRLPSSTPPSVGARSITAEELAALVAERSGKRVEVRRLW